MSGLICLRHGSNGAFNYIPGRSNIVGNWETGKGFTKSPQFAVASLCASGWTPIKRKDTYARYLLTLSACRKELNASSWKLVDLEMALFANAELQCAAAPAKGRPI